MMFMFTSTHVAAMAKERAERAADRRIEHKVLNDRLTRAHEQANRLAGRLATATRELSTARATLAQIAAMETPSCASIGRRMASAARGGVAPAAAPVAEGAR